MNEESKDLEVVQGGAVMDPNRQAYYDQFCDETTDEVLGQSIYRLKIKYPGSIDAPPDAPAGVFYVDVTGDHMERVRAIAIRMKSGHTLFPSPYRPGNTPICMSDDTIVPNGRGTAPLPGPCRQQASDGSLIAVCRHLQWGEDHAGRRIPPACTLQAVMLLWLMPPYDIPVIFAVKKKGTKAVKKMKEQMIAMGKRLRNPDCPEVPGQLVTAFDIGLQNEGTYWTPTFRMLREKVPVETSRRLHQMAPMLIDAFMRTQIEDVTVAEETVEAGNGNGGEDNNDQPVDGVPF